MFAPEFDYYRASSIAEASELLRKHPGAKLLAGGHSLIPLLKLRLASPSAVVDIGRIRDLRGISVDGDTIRIGALTTHAELSGSLELYDKCPILVEAAQQIGDPCVRNRGTIGGNVAHADPASDLPTVLTALQATFVVSGPAGARRVGAGDFFQGMMATAVGEHDVLTSIEITVHPGKYGTAYVKFSHPASRYAVIGVAAIVTVGGDVCAAASVAIGGLAPKPVRAMSVERAIVGNPLSAEVIAKAAPLVDSDLGRDVLGDLYASAEYRRAVAPVWVKRALTAAAERS
jgi:carbon-monoxide dehydrogenase medium subunit